MRERKSIIAFMLCMSIFLFQTAITSFYASADENTQPVPAKPAVEVVATASLSGTCGETTEWQLDSEGTLTVSGNGDAMGWNVYDSETIPKLKKETKRVVISEGITYIGSNMFSGFTNLKSVTLPDTLTTLSWGVFSGCTNLEDINIPAGLSAFEGSVFDDTPWLKKKQEENPLVIFNNILLDGTTCNGDVVIPDNVTCINDSAFADCEGMTSIAIPNSVTEIHEWAFSNCLGLQEISMPDSVTLLGVGAFASCTNLTDVKFSKGLTELRPEVFYNCTPLTSIKIPDNITSISEDQYVGVCGTFEGCVNLKEIIFPCTMTSIDAYAFEDTAWLRAKQIENPMVIINGILVNGAACSGDVIIPENVHRISCDAFAFNKELQSVLIPDNVTSVGRYAFCWCENLRSVKLPAGLTYIQENTFQDCGSLEIVEIPDNVQEIAPGAFHNCICLYSVKLPQELERIGCCAFEGCISLSSMTIPKSVQKIEWNAFNDTPWLNVQRKKQKLVIVNGILIDGTECYGDVVIPDTVTSIADYAFFNTNQYSNIVSIRIPESVKSIGECAFSRCASLREIIILNPDCDIHDEPSTICNGQTQIYYDFNVQSTAAKTVPHRSMLRNITVSLS